MKVLHIMNALLPSGAETMLFSSGPFWGDEYEMHILATAEKTGEYAPVLEEAGFRIHHIHKNSYFDHHKAVRNLMKTEVFDIVHIHCQGQALSYTIDAKLAGINRIIRTIHNVFVFHGVVQIREYIARHLSVMLGVKYVSISPSVTNNEKKRFGINPHEIRNWYNDKRFNFVSEDEKKSARTELGIAKDVYCIISVGNCTPVKNHMSILRTIVKYKEDPLFNNILYLHLGKGTQEHEELEYIRNNQIEHLVKYIGFSDPVKYLSAADLFVMPSEYEGFGISGIEGAATGIKAIFTEVPGLIDFKELKAPNLLFCRYDDDAIAAMIYSCVKTGRQNNSVEQAEIIKKMFGIAGGVEMYKRIYED